MVLDYKGANSPSIPSTSGRKSWEVGAQAVSLPTGNKIKFPFLQHVDKSAREATPLQEKRREVWVEYKTKC